jgi:LysM repeat protein
MSKRYEVVVLAFMFLAMFFVAPVVSYADDFALPPPPDANEDLALPAAGSTDEALPPPPGDETAAATSSADSSALPPPPGDDSSALPPPPSEDTTANPPALQDEVAAPAAEEAPAKVTKKKSSEGSPKAGTAKYSVKNGDSLWRISGKETVYGDSFKWPLLFKANKAKIDDPDLIYPRQSIKVSKDFTADEEADAVNKSKETPAYEPHSQPRKKLPIKY